MIKNKTPKELDDSIIKSSFVDGTPFIKYKDFLDETNVSIANNKIKFNKDRLELIKYIYFRVMSITKTYKKVRYDVYSDLAKSTNASFKASRRIIIESVLTWEFLKKLFNFDNLMYKKAMDLILNESIDLETIIVISCSKVSFKQQKDVLCEILRGKEVVITNAVKLSCKPHQKVIKKSIWKTENMLYNYMHRYLKFGSKIYMPFNPEINYNFIVKPSLKSQKNIIDSGFVDERGDRIKDNTLTNTFVVMPKQNVLYNNVSLPYDSHELFEYESSKLILESHRTLKNNGILGFVSWNFKASRCKYLYDADNFINNTLKKKFNYITSFVIALDKDQFNLNFRNGFRILHIVKK